MRIPQTYIEKYMSAPQVPENLAIMDSHNYKTLVKYSKYYNRITTEAFLANLDSWKEAIAFYKSKGLTTTIIKEVIGNKSAYLNCALPSTYIRLGGKTYLPDSQFHRDFLKVKLDDVQFHHLPSEGIGYIQFPTPITDDSGVIVHGGFYYCGDYLQVHCDNWFSDELIKRNEANEFKNSIILLWEGIEPDSTKDRPKISQNFIHIDVPKDPTSTLKSKMKDLDNVDYCAEGGKRITVVKDAYKEVPKLLFKYMVYLKSGDPDIRHFRNTLSYVGNSTTKVTKKDRLLSREELVLLGYGYKKENLAHTEAWQSTAHMGWRRCGAGRKEIRLVYVKGSTKSWKTKEEGTEANA